MKKKLQILISFLTAALFIIACGEKSKPAPSQPTNPTATPTPKTASDPVIKPEAPSSSLPAGWVRYQHPEHGVTVMAPSGSEKIKEMRTRANDRKNFAYQYRLGLNAIGQVNAITLTGPDTDEAVKEMEDTINLVITKMAKKPPTTEKSTYEGQPALKFEVKFSNGGQALIVFGVGVVLDAKRFAIMFGISAIGSEADAKSFLSHVKVE